VATSRASRRGASQDRARAQQDESAGIVGALGPRIAKERLVRGLSIEDLAEHAGISHGLLSQLERGIGNPSLATLVGLASALGVPLGSFFAGNRNNDDILVRRRTRKRLTLADRRMKYQLLVPDLQGSLSMLYIELPADFSNEQAPFSHPGEECELVLEGRVEAHIGPRMFLLEPGDSIRFASAIPHWFKTFDEPVVIVSAMTPPSF
jgi:transcriptional regulator with XRE-family HTH domain